MRIKDRVLTVEEFEAIEGCDFIEIEDMFLTNKPSATECPTCGAEMKTDYPVEAYIFVRRCIQKPKSVKREIFVVTIYATDKDDLSSKMAEFAEGKKLIDLCPPPNSD